MEKIISLECLKCRLKTEFNTELKKTSGLELFCNTCGASLGLADFVLKKPITQKWIVFAALIEKRIETGEGFSQGSPMSDAFDACVDWGGELRKVGLSRD